MRVEAWPPLPSPRFDVNAGGLAFGSPTHVEDELLQLAADMLGRLGLVGRGGAGPHDLKRLARRGRMLDWAGESQYYVEPKRLARLGYLDARKEPGKTRERTVYTLTAKGLEALRQYAQTPVRFTPLKSEPLLRLLICDLVGEAITRESMGTLREDIADLQARLDDSVQTAEALPHRSKYLLMAIAYLRRMLDLHLDLVDEVEREFDAGDERVTA